MVARLAQDPGNPVLAQTPPSPAQKPNFKNPVLRFIILPGSSFVYNTTETQFWKFPLATGGRDAAHSRFSLPTIWVDELGCSTPAGLPQWRRMVEPGLDGQRDTSVTSQTPLA